MKSFTNNMGDKANRERAETISSLTTWQVLVETNTMKLISSGNTCMHIYIYVLDRQSRIALKLFADIDCPFCCHEIRAD